MQKTDVKVELFYSGSWHDITLTEGVYTRDPITITRGRPDESQRVTPSTLNLTINNRNGYYSPRNPRSPLYRLIGRNTPIRVSVSGSYRFWGEVESWPQRWGVDGKDAWTPITANGILRRLNAPGTTRPAQSPLRRAVLAAAPIAYWPLEDARAASSIASGLLNGQPMVFGSTPPLCGDDKLAPGSVAGVDVGNEGFATGQMVGGANGSWSVSFVTNFVRRDGDLTNVITVEAGGIRAQALQGLSSVQGSVFGPSNSVALTGGSIAVTNAGNRRPHHIVLTATQSGADATVTMRIDGVQTDTDTITGVTVTPPTSVTINGDPILPGDSLADGTSLLLGHVAVYNSVFTDDLTAAMEAHAGETAVARIERLCSEEGIAVTIIGDVDDSESVGVQRAAPVLDLIYDAVDADGGLLYEVRDDLALAHVIHSYLYNQDPALTLNYAAGAEVAPPLEPVEDTDVTGNDITVTRYQGGSAQVVQETGTLNVQEPTDDPDGVGRYRKDFNLVLFEDGQCLPRAAWEKHLGTWDEARYPVINMDLSAMRQDGKTSLIANALGLDIGDRLAIENPPSWLPPDSIVQVAQGFVEEIGSHTHTIAVNATPALPYDVLELETDTTQNLSRIPAATGATTLNEVLDTTETDVDIISTKVRWIDSATYGSQFPLDVLIGGERMRVTVCTGTTLTQTFTVVRSINGVVKTHAIGTPVQLFRPPVIAR